jgi:oxygen-independent coproporphyrinogen-3 oxidase
MKNKSALLESIQKEIMLRKDELEQETLETIYFGGGTPSILSPVELAAILETIHKNFSVSTDAEITIEANPDDLLLEKIVDLKLIGINRLSIGVQSFFEEDLRWMNRAHNALQARNSIENARKAGISNISVDLIFATPLLSMAKLAENLIILDSYNIPHLSCYNLTIEERTKLHQDVKKMKVRPISDESAIEQFYFIRKYLMGKGYEHYEISNYAREGRYSRHNTAYWQRKKYLGIGPSAHSYNGKTRSWNIRNNENYIKALKENVLPFEIEVLSEANRFNELILTGLRTQWGLNLGTLETEFREQFLTIKPSLDLMIKEKKLIQDHENLTINPSFLVMADTIASDLFII